MLKSLEKKAVSETLGLLLIGANIVQKETIDEAAKTAKALGVPLERALTMSGYVRELALKLALEANMMVKEGMISLDLAIKALRLARSNDLDLSEALRVLDAVHKKTKPTAVGPGELHHLLIASDMVSKDQLQRALTISQDTGMQVGRILVLNRELSNWMMMAALSAQVMVYEGKITKDEAVQGLKAVGRHRITIEQALCELGFYVEPPGQTVKIGELFTMASYLNESDLMECLEIQLVKEKQFGQVLMEQGLANQAMLETAITLQGMVANETLKAWQAAEALKQMRNQDVSLYQVVAELKSQLKENTALTTITNLLIQAQVVRRELIGDLVNSDEKSAIKTGKKLLASGLMDEITLYNALRCHSLLQEGYVTLSQAVNVLKLCTSDNLAFDDALPKLGINVPARMQWIWT